MPQSESATPEAIAVYLAKEGQPTGPFSMQQLSAMVAQGSVSASDLAWHEGVTTWIPVAELLPRRRTEPVPPPPSMEQAKSRVGLAGSIIGLAGIPIWLVIVVVAATGQSNPGSQGSRMMFVGFSAIAMLGVNIVGAVLGFMAVVKESQRKTLTMIGLVLNIAQVLGILLLMFIGLTMKK
jgi:hypothetical protein